MAAGLLIPNEGAAAGGCGVVADTAGWGGHSRLTCPTHNATLVAQPWMNQSDWDQRVATFHTDHPCETIRIIP